MSNRSLIENPMIVIACNDTRMRHRPHSTLMSVHQTSLTVSRLLLTPPSLMPTTKSRRRRNAKSKQAEKKTSLERVQPTSRSTTCIAMIFVRFRVDQTWQRVLRRFSFSSRSPSRHSLECNNANFSHPAARKNKNKKLQNRIKTSDENSFANLQSNHQH